MTTKSKSGSDASDGAHVEPAAEQDETKRPLKIGGVPPNLPKQFPGKGNKNFGHANPNKGRNFRHQGR